MAQTADDPFDPLTVPKSPLGAPERMPDAPSGSPSRATEPAPGSSRPPETTPPKPRRPLFPRLPSTPGRRRTRVEIRHVGPLSVLKFSLLFYFCAMLIGFIALFLIFQVLEAAGTITTLETNILGCLFQEGERATTGECIPYEINGSVVFTWLFLLGIAGTVVIAVLNTFIAVVYNLISDIVGGVEVTLAERTGHQ